MCDVGILIETLMYEDIMLLPCCQSDPPYVENGTANKTKKSYDSLTSTVIALVQLNNLSVS